MATDSQTRPAPPTSRDVRESTHCPTCDAKPGQHCAGRNGARVNHLERVNACRAGQGLPAVVDPASVRAGAGCPRCGASKGQNCIGAGGEPREANHRARVRVYLGAKRSQRSAGPRKPIQARHNCGSCPLCGRRIVKGEQIHRGRYLGAGTAWEHVSCPDAAPVVVRRIGEPKPQPQPTAAPAGVQSCPTCHLQHSGDCF